MKAILVLCMLFLLCGCQRRHIVTGVDGDVNWSELTINFKQDGHRVKWQIGFAEDGTVRWREPVWRYE